MKLRTIVLVIATLIILVTAVNLWSDNISLLSKLPESRVEQARKEALSRPFLQREHRIERRPRLESADAALNNGDLNNEKGAALEVGAGRNSQGLKTGTLGHEAAAKQQAKYHVLPTVDGSIYSEWQVRVCYYWYKKMKEQYPDSALGGFTRILHSGKADNFTHEIPTAVVDPLPPGVDQGYVVLNRPYAFLQWVQNFMPWIPEDYIFMAEPDHIFVKPPPLWATPTKAAAYPFSYIEPQKNVELINRFISKNVSVADMAPIGNSPVQIHKRQFEGIVQDWYNISMRMKYDADASKAFSWILEMYAYSISSAQAEGGPLKYELHPELIVQPPWNPNLAVQGEECYIVHFTYGMDYDRTGRMVHGKKGDWHWDKRDYTIAYPPKNISMPPPPIDAPAITYLLTAINEASASLPDWRGDTLTQ